MALLLRFGEYGQSYLMLLCLKFEEEVSGGVFKAEVDGNLGYSKKRTGQFPDEAGLVENIRGR